ncbi:MAG: hypothetical protein IJS04_00280 [Muribaculaceae bacterium]|nr:hypothetical protein [Muribaculaceae bacterium]
MKKIFTLILLAGALVSFQMASHHGHCSPSGELTADVQRLQPVAIDTMANMTVAEYEHLAELVDKGEIDFDSICNVGVFGALYDQGCSWYCGGAVDTLTASGSLDPQGGFTYGAMNAHDFDLESVWATDGNGIGQYLTFTFAGNNPRITSVAILNGHVKSEKAWRDNSRVKTLLMYYNDKPYRLLELEDSRSLQYFDVDTVGYGPDVENAPKWTLKFEIKEVYPGAKYQDCVIADFIFDGIDVH